MQPGPDRAPDVSVIIPTFNRLWSLPETIESCRRNDCATEIIVVDDGSVDHTWEWLQSQHDVISVRQPNWGQDNAINLGFGLSRGEFVRFLDSDDLLPEHANDLELEIGRRTRADVVVAGFFIRDEVAGHTRRSDWVRCDDFLAQQLGECDSSHYSAYLLRREFIAGIPHRQEFAFREDRMFIIEVALRYPVVAVCDTPCLIHRHHSRERVQFPKGMREVVTNWQHLQLYKKALTILDMQGELTGRRKRAAAAALWPLAHWIARTHLREARELVEWIYELVPDFIPPDKGPLGLLYRRIGFNAAQHLLRVRRTLLSGFGLLRQRAA